MDTLAKDLAQNTVEDDSVNLTPHKLSFKAPIHTSIIRENMKDSLYISITQEIGYNYWEKKERYYYKDRRNIEWQSQYKAMKTIPTTRQQTLSKWFSGWLGTGKNMQRWKLRYLGNCPFCGAPQEDTNHVLKCNHPIVSTTWKTLLSKYDVTLAKMKTSFPLQKAIILELRAWRNNTEAPLLAFADPQLHAAIKSQSMIGWRGFL